MSYDASIIGLGKLGASMLAGMASRGLKVIGVDISSASVEAVNAGCAPVQETNLDSMIKKYKDNIKATLSFEEAVSCTNISFVIVPTPSDSRGAFLIKYVVDAFTEIGKVLKNKDFYHTVVLTSTVLPGVCRHGLLPVLEKESGKKCGKDFGLCYNPEFIALGSVIKDFLNPDFYLLGQFDERSGDALAQIHNKVSANKAPIKRMSLENAEIAKIAINSFVTLKISYANILAEICERVPTADVDVVSDAIGQDSRIGRKYLTGGLGFGGPCFPRDNIALNFLGRQIGVDTSLLKANDAYNRNHGKRILDRFKNMLPKSGKICVLGLSYKPYSHVIEESASIILAESLLNAGYSVYAYDPLVDTLEGINCIISKDIKNCLNDSVAVFVANADPQFIALSEKDFPRDAVVVDFWRCLNSDVQNSKNIKYVPAGRCSNSNIFDVILGDLWK